MQRAELLSLLNLASAALAEGEESIPIFRCICFTKDSITTYNDVIAVRLKNPGTGFEGTAPGQLLVKFVRSCTGKEIVFEQGKSEGKWSIKSGPTRLDFSCEDPDKFAFKFPPASEGLAVGDVFFEALRLCSRVVDDRGMTAWTAGVICHFSDKGLTMVACNGGRNSVHIYEIPELTDMPADEEVQLILPISFCKTVLDMRKQFSDHPATFSFDPKYAVVRFGDWDAAFCKTIIPEENLDIVQRALKLAEGVDGYVPITEKLRENIKRAADLGGDESSDLVIGEDGKVLLRTKLGIGVIRDQFSLTEPHPEIQVRIQSKKVELEMNSCVEFAVTESVTGMRSEDGKFIKLVANKV